jgi:hypothetical protein
MDERTTKRRGPIGWLSGRSRRFWGIAAAALPVLYIASCGPALWVITRVPQPDWALDAYRFVYAPLGWGCEHSPALNGVVTWYSERFVPPAPLIFDPIEIPMQSIEN